MAYRTFVDPEKCDGCEECLEACTAGVLEMQGTRAVAVRLEDCVGCKSCMDICPEQAISVTETQLELSRTCAELLKDIL